MSKIEAPAANGGPADAPSYVKRHHRRRPSKKLMRSVHPKDPMTTAAAIDRLVHHSTIIDMTGPSIRSQEALKKEPRSKGSGTKTTQPSA